MKTLEELNRLKTQWFNDPSWDIEDTEGFEEHREELLEYSNRCKAHWESYRNKTMPFIQTITLRDYFAGQALLGAIGGKVYLNNRTELSGEDIAIIAYKVADAMLAEREKRNGKDSD